MCAVARGYSAARRTLTASVSARNACAFGEFPRHVTDIGDVHDLPHLEPVICERALYEVGQEE
jgi:hypothetical protein